MATVSSQAVHVLLGALAFGIEDAVKMIPFALLALVVYAIPFGVATLLLLLVLRHHRRELVKELRALPVQLSSSGAKAEPPPQKTDA